MRDSIQIMQYNTNYSYRGL